MSARALGRLLAAYAVLLVALVLGVRAWIALAPPREAWILESRWRGGALAGRRVRLPYDAAPPAPAEPGVSVVEEAVVGEGPLSLRPALFTFSLVSGKDGVRAEIDGKTAWVTADDLLAAQAYDKGAAFLDPSLGVGTQQAVVVDMIARQTGASPKDVEARATATRVRFERRAEKPRITPASLDRAVVTEALREAARYLARAVDDEGRFRYIVLAPSDRTLLGGYSWPRHAGATFMLAQAAGLLDDAEIRAAALRAAARLRDQTMVDCGPHRCIADDAIADVGSSALAVVAFTELVRTGADASYRRAVVDLAEFLRAQQRPDGEMMHLYDRAAKRPKDVQLLYFTGEAALALARAHAITDDPRDLEASERALAHLVGPGWHFFGSRYYFSEEHWTCQTVAELWDRAPSEEGLAFCLRWHEYQRRLQHEDGDSPYDADGAFGVGPIFTPRVTPASSRGEAAGAALEVLRKRSPRDDATIRLLDDELRRAVAFVLREQLLPGPTHLFVDPDVVRGAFPGSHVDLALRIDYGQHAGAMLMRWLALESAAEDSSRGARKGGVGGPGSPDVE